MDSRMNKTLALSNNFDYKFDCFRLKHYLLNIV